MADQDMTGLDMGDRIMVDQDTVVPSDHGEDMVKDTMDMVMVMDMKEKVTQMKETRREVGNSIRR